MWLFVMFDLPVITKKERDAATGFRNRLLEHGFEMAQFSIYLKYCATVDKAESVCNQIKQFLPIGGKVDILTITDKQFSNIRRYHGRSEKKHAGKPQQLQLF